MNDISSMNPTGSGYQASVNEHEGYVAFLDVLGFRSIVGSRDWEERLTRYVKRVDRAIQANDSKMLQYVIFSDSVIVNSTEDDDESFQRIVEACATLFAQFLQDGIALRGAIAHGRYLRSSEANGTFVAGAPIVEAVDYETRQNWVGIMLCPSTIKRQIDLDQRCRVPQFHEINPSDLQTLRLPALLLRNPSIPFHREDKSSLLEPDLYDGYAVLPTGAGVLHMSILQKLDEGMKALEALKLVAPDPKAQAKFKSAIQWLGFVQQAWKPIVDATHQAGLSS